MADINLTHAPRKNGLWLGLHADLRAATIAGLTAGAIFLLVDLLATALIPARISFGPAYITLHGMLGAETIPGAANPGLLLAAIFIHFALSVLLAVPVAAIIHPWQDRAAAGAVGLALGVALYFINFHLFAVAMPLLEVGRDPFMIGSYAIFGMVLAWVYVRIVQRHRRTVTS